MAAPLGFQVFLLNAYDMSDVSAGNVDLATVLVLCMQILHMMLPRAVTVNADAAYFRVLLTHAVTVNADAAYFHVLLTRAVTVNADAAYFHVLLTPGFRSRPDVKSHVIFVNY